MPESREWAKLAGGPAAIREMSRADARRQLQKCRFPLAAQITAWGLRGGLARSRGGWSEGRVVALALVLLAVLAGLTIIAFASIFGRLI